MIYFEEVKDYIDLLNKNNRLYEYYKNIINFESVHYIPAVRFETALFLKFLSSILNPDNVLEIGFGSGASSLFIAYDLQNNNKSKVISLERDINRVNRGQNVLKHFNNKIITLLHYDAFDYFSENEYQINNTFDIIFLDAVKRDYIKFINPIKKALKTGGLLITDNTLFGGKTAVQNIDKIEKRYINGVNLLKEFNKTLSMDTDFEVINSSLGDGLSICRKVI